MFYRGWWRGGVGEGHSIVVSCMVLGEFVLLTQRVASRCGTLHVKVVAFVEAAALGPVRGIAARVFLVLGRTFIVGRVGTGDVDVRLGRGSVACRCPGWRLVSLCYLLHVCWDV